MSEKQRAQIGILMLESRFPRFPGDIGHPATFDPPALMRTIVHATPSRIVYGRAKGLVEQFQAGARDLQKQGATLITTSCGFLMLHQAAIQAVVDIPVISSALQALPTVIATLNPLGMRPAILTISKTDLTHDYLLAAGAPLDTIVGAPDPGGEFCTAILGNLPTMDQAAAANEVTAAAIRLMRTHANIGALVLECTNMPPYAQDLARHCNIPVLSLPGLLPDCQNGMSLAAATRKALAM